MDNYWRIWVEENICREDKSEKKKASVKQNKKTIKGDVIKTRDRVISVYEKMYLKIGGWSSVEEDNCLSIVEKNIYLKKLYHQ